MIRVTKYLVLLVLPFILLSCAWADNVPVRILLGNSETPLGAVNDGNHVYAPIPILELLGATYTTTSDSNRIVVTSAEGKTGDITTSDINGTSMVPMDSVAELVNAESTWDNDHHTLTLLARLTSVEYDDDTLKINCSFPVPSSAHDWGGKVVVDVQNAKLATEAKEVFIGTDSVSKARLGQPNDTTSRVVLDLAKTTGYKLMTSGKATQIALKLGNGLSDTVKPQPAPKQPALPPFTINSISVESVSDDAFDVVISTSSKGAVNAAYGVVPPMVSLSFPGGKLGDSVNEAAGSHAMLKSAGVGADKWPVINLRLTRPMAYGVEVGSNKIIVHIRPPDKSGGTLAGKFIIVDPGHGGREKGALAGGCCEKDINMQIARDLADALENEGAKVMLTRDGDQVVGLSARPEIAIDNGADFFIAVHCNSNGAANSATGIETYYHMQEPSPKVLAYAVHAAVCASTGMCDRSPRSDRSLYTTGLAVLRRLTNTGIPGVLLECGYVNNSSDRAKLLSASYRSKLVEGIVAGFKAYVEGTPIK